MDRKQIERNRSPDVPRRANGTCCRSPDHLKRFTSLRGVWDGGILIDRFYLRSISLKFSDPGLF